MLKILIAISVIWAAFVYFMSTRAWQQYYSHEDVCDEYLRHQSDTWQREGDSWYKNQCDPRYEYSMWKIKYGTATDVASMFDTSGVIVAALGAVVLVSYIGRWVVIGRKSK